MVSLKRTLTLGALACLLTSPAFACAMLVKGDPKVGSVVNGKLDHVTLIFSGKIYPAKSTLQVTDATGGIVSAGKAYGDDTTLSTAVKSLAPGIYKVRWNTFCDCQSYTPGDYKFTVQ